MTKAMAVDGEPIYLNGAWVPRSEAKVSAFDRGFIFGDGVYELVQAYARKPFYPDRHVKRLAASLASVEIPNPHSDEQWLELIDDATKRSEHENQRVYMQVTRGVAPRMHRFPEKVTPTVMMFSDPLVLPDAEALDKGFLAVTHEDFRWMRGDIKATSLMAAVLASEHAARAGATETIFVRNGIVTEGASSNVLLVRDGTLLSPVIDRKVLAGVTLAVLDEIAAQGMELVHRDISEDELRTADELMISSSGKEVMPITALDGAKVGDGKPGPFFRRLWQGFQDRVRELQDS